MLWAMPIRYSHTYRGHINRETVRNPLEVEPRRHQLPTSYQPLSIPHK